MNHRKLSLLLTIIFGVLFFVAPAVRAQVNTATIYGNVTDSSGSQFPGAVVTITNEQTGATQSATTNQEGEFTFEFLQIGRYTLAISASGFKEQSQPNIELIGGQRLRLNYALEVGSISEKVTVTSETPLINAVNAEQQISHGTEQVRELPLARRDWTNLITIGTGLEVRGSATGTGVSINGLPPGGLSITVDGTQASGSSESTSLTSFGNFNLIKVISLEAISEVNISKGILSAEHANTLSGNVGIITKSGSNEFHGSLFENYIGRALNARNPFLATRPNEVFNQFGGSFGGPIIKNKLFFFGVYEGYRQNRFVVFNSNLPTAEFRATAIAAVPAYKAFFDQFPLPNQAYAVGAQTGGFIGTGPQTARDNHMVFRGDYNINDNNRISSRYTRGRPQSNSFIDPVTPFDFIGLTDAFTASYYRTGAAYSSETRFGLNSNDVTRNIAAQFLDAGIPAIGGLSFPGGDAEILASRGKGWSIEEVVAFNRGRHSIKLGGIFQYQNQTRSDDQSTNLTYSSEADFLANNPSRIAVTYGLRPYVIRDYTNGYFIQDDFKLRSNIILNLGLRWDYFSVPTEKDNRFFNRDGAFGLGPLRSQGQSLYNSDKNNFAPRVGFAWSLGKDAKTVVRSGFGVFYTRTPLFIPIDTVRDSLAVPFRFTFSLADARRYGLKYPVTKDSTRALVTDPNAPWSGSVINTDFPTPYSMQWILSLQRQLTNSISIDTAYVGTRGVHIDFGRQINTVNRVTGLRPYAGFGEFHYYDTSDATTYHAWQTTIAKRFSNAFLFNVNYTWAHSTNLGGVADLSYSQNASPQDSNNLQLDKGPTPYDIHNRFSADALYELPFARWWGSDSRAKRLLYGGWQLSSIVRAESGAPFSIAMPNSILGQRVDYIGGDPYLNSTSNPLQYLNTAAFARVPIIAASGASARPGTLGRNALRLPGFWNVDLTVAKNLALTERVRMQLRADMINAFNHTNFLTINSTITSGNFGRFTSTRDARVIQLNMRFTF